MNCRGLPLAIVAVSGLLAKSSRTVEYWKCVANDTYGALNVGGDELCFEILYLSYMHLPVHLRPCFLYMAIFPEDHKIGISRLVKQWVAEGLLKPIRSRSLQEIAEDNLKDLTDRNLIQVHAYGRRNKIKTCTIHDLFRNLCLREAQKENFRCVTMHSLKNHSRIIDNERLLIIRRSSDQEESNSTLAKLHRLRKVVKTGYVCSDEEVVRLVNSRYIDYYPGNFSELLNSLESLSVVWNLQAIVIAGWDWSGMPMKLPAEIWEMPQLRCLKRTGGDFHLPDPLSTTNKNGRQDVVMKNLQTLHKVRNLRCTDEVVRRIPSLKKLGITYREFPEGIGWDHYQVHNLARLQNLESLFLYTAKEVPQTLCFPRSLKKLTLENCELPWEYLTVVGSLPHLEVLNLMHFAVRGRGWNPVEGQFLELKSLTIQYSDVEEWIADRSHFPRLEKLKLSSLYRLKEIPEDLGEIPTLRSILLYCCHESADSSAEKIREEQHDAGNFDLQVRIIVGRFRPTSVHLRFGSDDNDSDSDGDGWDL